MNIDEIRDLRRKVNSAIGMIIPYLKEGEDLKVSFVDDWVEVRTSILKKGRQTRLNRSRKIKVEHILNNNADIFGSIMTDFNAMRKEELVY